MAKKGLKEGFIRPGVKQHEHRINEEITAKEVRIVGEGIETVIVPIDKALEIAAEKGLDLVEIVPNAQPPVCKVIDYGKFLYERKKKEKEIKAKTAKVIIKDIRFSPHIDDHDFAFKKKHAEEFLKEGCKVRAFIMFKGREIIFKEKGEELLMRFVSELEEFGAPEDMPKLEGKKMQIIIAPKKKKK
jgi:translation initiation factor IF-3